METIIEIIIILFVVLAYLFGVKKNKFFFGIVLSLIGILLAIYRFILINGLSEQEILNLWMNKYLGWIQNFDKGQLYIENGFYIFIMIIIMIGSIINVVKKSNDSN
jgi:hypothetical protein